MNTICTSVCTQISIITNLNPEIPQRQDLPVEHRKKVCWDELGAHLTADSITVSSKIEAETVSVRNKHEEISVMVY